MNFHTNPSSPDVHRRPGASCSCSSQPCRESGERHSIAFLLRSGCPSQLSASVNGIPPRSRTVALDEAWGRRWAVTVLDDSAGRGGRRSGGSEGSSVQQERRRKHRSDAGRALAYQEPEPVARHFRNQSMDARTRARDGCDQVPGQGCGIPPERTQGWPPAQTSCCARTRVTTRTRTTKTERLLKVLALIDSEDPTVLRMFGR